MIAGGAFLLFKKQLIWFPWVIIIVQIAAALLWSIIFNSVQLYVQKRLFEQILALHLPPKLVKKFSKDPKFLKPGAEKQLLTIFFSDIANFTSVSEGLDSDELARLMNDYFQAAVSGCIHKTDGTVVKYIGDAIFAFWNAPDPQVNHPARACQAALLFREQPPHYVDGDRLHTRIGLHTGVANVGNFGSTERVDYTALGESINLASRMEGLNKYLGTELLITGDTKQGIDETFVTRFLGRFRLKGFEKCVDVYELIGRSDQAESSRPWRETFAAGLDSFQKGNFTAADEFFHRTIELHANDGPSRFYLAKIVELRDETLPAGWAGEVELKEK
jgi:adenylate cyclase